MKRNLLTLMVLLFVTPYFFSQNNLSIIPEPVTLEISNSSIPIAKQIQIIDKSKNSKEEIKIYNHFLKDYTYKFGTQISETKIYFEHKDFKNKNEYSINVAQKSNKDAIIVLYSSPESKFYAVQTITQILKQISNDRFPVVKINDYPKFDYRGMHLDVCRHFFNVDEVKSYLDYLAMYKLNKFHWHLTDDQGWRIEIKKYPKLTSVGAWRTGSQVGPYSDMKFDQKKYGGFYTQEQVKDVVNYAKKLHIDVIPEIEMPGHAQAALAAYPDLGCTKGPFEVWKQWGVSENIFCPKEETFKFLEDVLDEVIPLFPYEYIHIGGDEAPKKAWKDSQFAQNLIKEKGLKDEHGLQSYFITRMEKYLNSKGKQIIGWDEILEGGLAPNATVMSWTGIEGGIHAAQTQHKAIMTPTSNNYFDYYQGNPETEPLAIGGDVRLDKVYAYNPIPKVLTPEEEKYIWGTQANLWTEYILDFKHVEHMIFPRMMALSEVAWGTSNPEKYKDFEKRVISQFKILDKEKIDYSKAIFEVTSAISKAQNGNIIYTLSTAKNPENIRFTTDGTEPNANSKSYKNPIEVSTSQTIKAAYFENGVKESATSSQDFSFSKSTGKELQLAIPASKNYSNGNNFILVDGVRGNAKNYGKNWLGFSGDDCVATIDLKDKTNVSSVSFASLDRRGSWVYLPKSATIYVSENGKDFQKVQSVNQNEIVKQNGNVTINFPPKSARFVKVEIQNFGIIPDGSEGAGNKAWLFVDEIAVN